MSNASKQSLKDPQNQETEQWLWIGFCRYVTHIHILVFEYSLRLLHRCWYVPSLTQLVAAKYVPLLEVSFHFCFINQWVFLWLEFSVSEDFKSIHFFTTICSFYVAGVIHHQPKKGRSLAPPLRDTFIYCIRRKFNLLPARATVEAKKKTHFCLFLQQWEEFILYSRFSLLGHVPRLIVFLQFWSLLPTNHYLLN